MSRPISKRITFVVLGTLIGISLLGVFGMIISGISNYHFSVSDVMIVVGQIILVILILGSIALSALGIVAVVIDTFIWSVDDNCEFKDTLIGIGNSKLKRWLFT